MIKDVPILEIDIKEGYISSKYIPLLKLNSPLSKQLKEYKQIKMDLDMARSMFTNINRLADEELNYILKHSLWFTAVVTYNRCFNSGNGRGVKLDKKKYIDHLNQELIDAHEEITNQRNQYIAHAGINDYEAHEVFAVLDFDQSTILGLSNLFDRTIVINSERADLYGELVGKVIEKVAEEEDKKAELLLNELAKINVEKTNIVSPMEIADERLKGEFYYLIADRYCNEIKDYFSGIHYLTKAIELLPDMWELYANRSMVYGKLGDCENQAKDLKKVNDLKEK